MPGPFKEHALFAEARAANVAHAVEHSEHRAVLQHSRAVFDRRRLGRYVVLLGDVNFIQLRAPSLTLNGAFLREVKRS